MASNLVQRCTGVSTRNRILTAFLFLGVPVTSVLADPVPAPGPPAAVAPLPPFAPYKVKRGVAIDRRPVPGSRFYEYRAGFTTPLAARLIVDLVWRNTTVVTSDEIIKKRQILRDSATERVFYDQVKTPVVSDRDYTLVVRRVDDPAAQRFQVTYETANQLGPPLQPGFVRIPVIRGSWTAESDGQGGTRMTYLNFSEPGGSIPALLVHGAQVDSVATTVLRLQERLSKVGQ